MKITRVALAVAVLACGGLGLVGCKRSPQKEHQRSSEPGDRPADAPPSSLFVAEVPAGARSVGDLKADANTGGEVAIHGRIGGRKDPFVSGTGVFLLADMSMKACNELHGDKCPTPWDYCCEPRESLAAKTATVQVVDAEGRPLRIELNGRYGLAPLVELTIIGQAAPRDSMDTLLINAKQIHVHRAKG